MKVKDLLQEKEWSQAVTDGPARTFAKKGTHSGTAEEIYNEYKKKKVSPKGLGSAIRMITFFINRAGKNLKNGDNLRKAREMLQADLAKEHAKVDEGKAGVKVVQSKTTQKKLRASGEMEEPGHYHRKGEDWESTKVNKPKESK